MTGTTPPIRLALVLQDLEFGGTQRQVLQLAARLDKTRYAVELWILRAGGGFIPEAESLGVPLRFLSKARSVGPAALTNLWRAMRKQRPDLMVAFTAVPNIWCRIMGRLAGLPIIVGTCRGGGSIRRQRERWLWRLAHHHICNASSLRKALTRRIGVPEDRVSLCENGVDVPPAASRSRVSGKQILSVGRLVEDKDQATLIKAFALAQRQHPEATLTLVGDGPLGPRLRDLAASLGVLASMTFLPGRPDLTALYAECAFFVLSSRTEASPNVLLEAAAAGKAVVATRVGGIPDLVEHEKTGLLVDSGSPEEMAEAISRLLAEPALCRAMGDAGRERVRTRFSVQNMVDRHAAIFAALLNRQKG